ncbi:hypothetical protein [Dyella sp. GSA-30]|uniref:hypothetical protein n=1 Tax=Dyella sp. GSA-30 TaxID=2994496 RepID=UPI002492C257|nr:hypothetical protein [Dyella sp. GSA-30]BDU21739.1 hypothetical protein DYGSA30_31960 [Dyella sp. GSA-30]
MRDDIGNKLVHLSKGSSDDPAKHRGEAAKNLVNILKEKSLRGGSGFIKGKHICVCFSEAPIGKLSQILASKDPSGFKYQPYGVLVDKKWLFKQGGRPAIYGPDPDYAKLPEDMQYRHVRFWLSDEYNIDHTWEREWRIKTEALSISPKEVTIVVPDRAAKEAFVEHGFAEWHYIALSDLGVEISPL